jgi:hypothetical protein
MFAEQTPEEEQNPERPVSADRVVLEAQQRYAEHEADLISRLSTFPNTRAIATSREARDLFHTACAYPDVAPEMTRMLTREAIFRSTIDPYTMYDHWRLLKTISHSREVDAAVASEVGNMAEWLVDEALGESQESIWVRKYFCEGLHQCITARPGAVALLADKLGPLQQVLESVVDAKTLSLGNPGSAEVLYFTKQLVEALHRAHPEEFPVGWLVDRCLSKDASDQAAFTAVDLGLKFAPESLNIHALNKFELGLKQRLETLNPGRLFIEESGLIKALTNYSRLADLLDVSSEERESVAAQLADLTDNDQVNQAVWKIIGLTDVWIDDRVQSESSATVLIMTEGGIRQIPDTTFSPFGLEDRELALEGLNRNYDEVVDQIVKSPQGDSNQSALVAALELCGDESLRALSEPERGELVSKRWGELLANEVDHGCADVLGLIYSRLPYLAQEYPTEIMGIRSGLTSALKHGMEQRGKGSASIMRMIDVPVFGTDEKIDLCNSALKLLEDGYVPADIFGDPDLEKEAELKAEVMLQLAMNLPLDSHRLVGLGSYLELREREHRDLRRKLPEYIDKRSR